MIHVHQHAMTQRDPMPDTRALVLPPEEAAVSRARRWVAEMLAKWPPAVVDDGRLIASELVTNAVVHGEDHGEKGDIHVLAYIRPEGPTIEVRDRGREYPTLREHDNDLEHGRGLVVVRALALRWGWCPLPTGKSVWAVLKTR